MVYSTTLAAAANTAGTYNRTSTTTPPYNQINARTGIQLPTNEVWSVHCRMEHTMLHIVSADSTNPNIVNNISGKSEFSPRRHRFNRFWQQRIRRVIPETVTNGFLRLSAGSGSVSPVLAYIDINAVTPPSVISSISRICRTRTVAGAVQHECGCEHYGIRFSAGESNDWANHSIPPTLRSAIARQHAIFTFPGYAGGMCQSEII